ncbi:hypothetical protein [Crenothrix polyspora]|uniref:hypothetical protein n=1 Tax=Crenothrix polyspora TaxID=360316 RepID=UPI0015935940|nr:hypothetical protein [Crenothrix polyspora]
MSLVEIIAFIFSLKFFKNVYVIDIISKADAAIQSKIHLQNMPNKRLAISYLLYQANALTDTKYEGLNDFLCGAYKVGYDEYRDRSVDWSFD